jgi:hypothetical protein
MVRQKNGFIAGATSSLGSLGLLAGPCLLYVHGFPQVSSSNPSIPGRVRPSFCRSIFLSCQVFWVCSLLGRAARNNPPKYILQPDPVAIELVHHAVQHLADAASPLMYLHLRFPSPKRGVGPQLESVRSHLECKLSGRDQNTTLLIALGTRLSSVHSASSGKVTKLLSKENSGEAVWGSTAGLRRSLGSMQRRIAVNCPCFLVDGGEDILSLW